MTLPLHVMTFSAGFKEADALEARSSIVAALKALDDPNPTETALELGIRTDFHAENATIETTVRPEGPSAFEQMPQSTLLRRSPDDRILGVILQSPYPLGWHHDVREGVRSMAEIALRAIDAAISPIDVRTSAGSASRSLLNAIGYKVMEAQGHVDADAIDVRLPSPFNTPHCGAWNGKAWIETLDVRHSAWHLVDTIQMTTRRQNDGFFLIHLASPPSDSPDSELDPVSIMRAVASLPPAPPPLRVDS